MAQQAEDKSGQASIEALADIGAGGMFGAAKRALRRGFERGMAENPRTDRAIGEMLFTDQGVRQKLEGLAAAQARNQASQQRTMTGRSRMGGRMMYPLNPVLQGAVQDEVRREEEVRRRGN